MLTTEPYNDIGLLKDIADDLSANRRSKLRPLNRHKPERGVFQKKKKAKKTAKASRRRNRG